VAEPTIDEISLADEGSSWSQYGFDVAGDHCMIGSVALRFAGLHTGKGITAWSLRELDRVELDGLTTAAAHGPPRAPAQAHPNGVFAIDHVVAVSPNLDRTVAALQLAGLNLRRVREEATPAGAPRQAFFRLGAEILELVQEPDEVIARHGGDQRPAHFWGLALCCAELERCVEAFGPHVGTIRDAVQPARRIASVKRSAGLSVPLALMSAVPEAVA
jgi:hypothetical protein